MDNPFSWDYMRTVPGPDEVFGPFSIVYLILFIVGLIGSVVVYNGWARQWFNDPVLHRMARKWAGIAIIVFGLGLFFFLIRWLQINPFGLARRLWLWVSLLSVLVWIGYAIWDYRTHYDTLKMQYDEQQRRRQYARTGTQIGASAVDRQKSTAVLSSGPRPRPVRRRRK